MDSHYEVALRDCSYTSYFRRHQTFLNEQWNTLKANLAAKNEQVCVGGFIFDWSDEYWKAGPDYYNVQVGGPDGAFHGGAFAGSYSDEAGYGVTSDVDQSLYGLGKPNISRTLFKGDHAARCGCLVSPLVFFTLARILFR